MDPRIEKHSTSFTGTNVPIGDGKTKGSAIQNATPYLFIAPHLVFFIIFLIVPIGYGIYISLHEWDYLTPPEFVGLQHYRNIFLNPTSIDYVEFWNAFWNTVQFVVFAVPVLIVVPLVLAVAVDTKTWGTHFFRAVFYAPSLLSVATVSLIWLWILDTNAGIVNFYLNKFGGETVPWLSKMPWAWIALVVMTVWWTIGRNMIIFLAGLQDIPEELHEAAKIDGAGRLSRFFHIILPGIRGPMLFCVVMTTIESFNLFGQPYMTTQGGPGEETEVLMMLIRQVGFADFRMGSAAAMALIMGFSLLLISMVQFAVMNRGQIRGPR
ncbi:carbohydrate ABC transporter membrane protein 1 (CUT1 family) [Melghirimyces profundicolus]|uniref:Carbohydrate ABC transporter membrane protein 1 (CUT1 family) n=1 Tax=Melghirimyces profundicolus TaxID=1242148 RepID=A0A2T6C7Z5_9BACL|nr:sugar ABC transporter permease [Melghirimyces profundicolus]PTX64434.1 carbohydrate ABC transporter membrane protein 1 (CUT1 family) [Melghirimyces profundicolus]